MDVNPYQFKASSQALEFANFQLRHRPNIILCSMAWLVSEDEDQVCLSSLFSNPGLLSHLPLLRARPLILPSIMLTTGSAG